MNNQGYIRKAVELADGFSILNDDVVGELVDHIEGLMSLDSPLVADGLAAQLVRQVDTTDYGITFDGDMGKVSVWGSTGFTPSVKSSSYGPDRTMNTIKVIVDSDVLAEKLPMMFRNQAE